MFPYYVYCRYTWVRSWGNFEVVLCVRSNEKVNIVKNGTKLEFGYERKFVQRGLSLNFTERCWAMNLGPRYHATECRYIWVYLCVWLVNRTYFRFFDFVNAVCRNERFRNSRCLGVASSKPRYVRPTNLKVCLPPTFLHRIVALNFSLHKLRHQQY